MNIRLYARLFIYTLLITACAREPDVQVPPLRYEDLKSANFPSEWTQSGAVILSDGHFFDESQSVSASLLELAAFGDLNRDDAEDAAVVLATNTGGSGVFIELFAVLNRNGQPDAMVSTYLGDRVRVHGLQIEDGEMLVNLTTHGPTDPMCCPTQQAQLRFRLDPVTMQLVIPHSGEDGAAPDQMDH